MTAWCAVAVCLSLVAMPVSAERIETYWRLEPVNVEAPATASLNVPFFEQRLLPVAMVLLEEDVSIGQRVIAKGTPLYLVFNDSGKIGYCTVKNKSSYNQIKTLFIPALDQRPCFVDSDNDGRFDRMFSVFDKYGGPPSVRGSIVSARPLSSPVAYRSADIHQFPTNITVSFVLTGKGEALKTHLGVRFSGSVCGNWIDKAGVPLGSVVVFDALNSRIILHSIDSGIANIEISRDVSTFISSDNHNNLYWHHLPQFLEATNVR